MQPNTNTALTYFKSQLKVYFYCLAS